MDWCPGKELVGLLPRSRSSLSRLELLRLLAPLVNFSSHDSPSIRHSSVMASQSAQHFRNGTVRVSSAFRLLSSHIGRELRRKDFSAAVVGESEEGNRLTRQGERGFVGEGEYIVRPRLGDRDMNLEKAKVVSLQPPATMQQNIPGYWDLKHDVRFFWIEGRPRGRRAFPFRIRARARPPLP